MSKQNHESEIEVEEFRSRLQTQLRDDYFHKIKNAEDPHAERIQLIATVSQALERLLDVEALFLNEMLEESSRSSADISR